MRMTATALIFIFGLAMIIVGYVAHSLVILQRFAVVDRVEGQVQVYVHGRGAPLPLQKGKLVRAGDVILTGPKSSAELRWVEMAGGARVRIGPDTRFTVMRALTNRRTKDEESRLRVDTGTIWVRLRKLLTGRSKFEVETPTVVAAVRGTSFQVAVGRDGQSRLEVYEGTVWVTGAEGGSATLTAGSETTWAKGQKAGEVRPLAGSAGFQPAGRAGSQPAAPPGPFLEVTSPAEGEQFGGNVIRVAGRAQLGTAVLVNGVILPTTVDGGFETTVPAPAGSGTVVVVARDGEGRQTSISRTVRAPSGAPAAGASGSAGLEPAAPPAPESEQVPDGRISPGNAGAGAEQPSPAGP